MNASELIALADALIKPTDPVEVRTGSMAAVRMLAKPGESTYPPIYGLPVVVDSTLPLDRIEVRARDGSTLVTVSVMAQLIERLADVEGSPHP